MDCGSRFVLWVLLLWAPSGVTDLFKFNLIIDIALISSSTSTSLPSGRRKSFFSGFLSSRPFSFTADTSSCEISGSYSVLMQAQVFWDVTPCRLVNTYRLVLGLLDPEDEGTTILRNVGIYQSTQRNNPEDLNLSLLPLVQYEVCVRLFPYPSILWTYLNHRVVYSFILFSIKYIYNYSRIIFPNPNRSCISLQWS